METNQQHAFSTLKRTDLCNTLNDDAIWRMAQLMRPQTFDKGEYLTRQGEALPACYFLIKGRVAIYYESPNGTKINIDTLSSLEIIGEIAVIDQLPASATAIALETTQVYAIDAWDFKAQIQAFPEIALQLLPVLTKRLRNTQAKLIQEHCHDEQ